MQYSNLFIKHKGFTLIESMLGIMLIGLVSGSIMLGITSVEKKLFKIRLKEKAFEALRNYTNFLGSRIAVGDIPPKPQNSDFEIPLYRRIVNNTVTDVYNGSMNYEEIQKVSHPDHNGQVYSLNTYIVWPNESEIKDSIRFNTYQIKLTN